MHIARHLSLTVVVALLLTVGCDQQESQPPKAAEPAAAAQPAPAKPSVEAPAPSPPSEAPDNQQLIELEQEVATLTEANAALTQEKESLATELATAKASLDEAQKRAVTAEDALAKMKAAHEKLPASGAAASPDAQKEIDTLKLQVAALTKKLEQALKALAEAKGVDVPEGALPQP